MLYFYYILRNLHSKINPTYNNYCLEYSIIEDHFFSYKIDFSKLVRGHWFQSNRLYLVQESGTSLLWCTPFLCNKHCYYDCYYKQMQTIRIEHRPEVGRRVIFNIHHLSHRRKHAIDTQNEDVFDSPPKYTRPPDESVRYWKPSPGRSVWPFLLPTFHSFRIVEPLTGTGCVVKLLWYFRRPTFIYMLQYVY